MLAFLKLWFTTQKKTLFSTEPIGALPESPEFIIEHDDWNLKHPQKRQRILTTPWRYIQGDKTVSGPLIGDCSDVLISMIISTKLWPHLDDFNEAILFLENSEERPSPDCMLYWLRNLGAQGILDRISGILFARPGAIIL